MMINMQEGRTGLMIAAWRGHSSIVAELVRAGAQVDAQDQVVAYVCVCVCVYVCMHLQNYGSQSMCTIMLCIYVLYRWVSPL